MPPLLAALEPVDAAVAADCVAAAAAGLEQPAADADAAAPRETGSEALSLRLDSSAIHADSWVLGSLRLRVFRPHHCLPDVRCSIRRKDHHTWQTRGADGKTRSHHSVHLGLERLAVATVTGVPLSADGTLPPGTYLVPLRIPTQGEPFNDTRTILGSSAWWTRHSVRASSLKTHNRLGSTVELPVAALGPPLQRAAVPAGGLPAQMDGGAFTCRVSVRLAAGSGGDDPLLVQKSTQLFLRPSATPGEHSIVATVTVHNDSELGCFEPLTGVHIRLAHVRDGVEMREDGPEGAVLANCETTSFDVPPGASVERRVWLSAPASVRPMKPYKKAMKLKVRGTVGQRSGVAVLRLADTHFKAKLSRFVVRVAGPPPLEEPFERRSFWVDVVAGRHLAAKDTGGTSDPYCSVGFGGDVHHLALLKKTLNPVWAVPGGNAVAFHRVRFPRPQPDDWTLKPLPVGGSPARAKLKKHQPLDSIVVAVTDWDLLSKDDFMGLTVLPVASLAVGQAMAGWVPVSNAGKSTHVSGELLVRVVRYESDDGWQAPAEPDAMSLDEQSLSRGADANANSTLTSDSDSDSQSDSQSLSDDADDAAPLSFEPSAGGLGDWQELKAGSSTYYRNRVTGETTWKPPSVSSDAEQHDNDDDDDSSSSVSSNATETNLPLPKGPIMLPIPRAAGAASRQRCVMWVRRAVKLASGFPWDDVATRLTLKVTQGDREAATRGAGAGGHLVQGHGMVEWADEAGAIFQMYFDAAEPVRICAFDAQSERCVGWGDVQTDVTGETIAVTMLATADSGALSAVLCELAVEMQVK